MSNKILGDLSVGRHINTLAPSGSVTSFNGTFSGTLNLTQASSLTMNGSTLNVTGNSSINQDVRTTASPSFAYVTLNNEPVNANHAVTKAYVDAMSAGLDTKESVLVATTGNVSTYSPSIGPYATGGFIGAPATVDGISLASGHRILVKSQTDRKQNGIYVASGDITSWYRASDMDGSPANEISGGNFTFVESGAVNNGAGYVVVGSGTLTLNVHNIIWTQFSDAGDYTASNGITKVVNDFRLDINGLSADTIAFGDSIAFYDTSGADTNKTTLTDLLNTLDIVYSIGSNGIIVRTSDDNYASRTISEETNGGIRITNGDGVSANPTIALEVDDLPSPELPLFINAYIPYASGSVGSITRKATFAQVFDVATGLGVPYGLDGTTGFIAKTGLNTYAQRTITPGSGIVVINGNGITSDPVISLDFAQVANGAGIGYNGNTLTLNIVELTSGSIGQGDMMAFHDNDTNALRKIDYASLKATISSEITPTAGSGLIQDSVTGLAVGQGNGITVSDDAVSVNIGTNLEFSSNAIRIAATAAGNGLTGAGASPIAVGAGSGIIVNADDVAINFTTIAGAGLTFGSNFLAVGAGSGIIVNADDVSIDFAQVANGAGIGFNGNTLTLNIPELTSGTIGQGDMLVFHDNDTDAPRKLDYANLKSSIAADLSSSSAGSGLISDSNGGGALAVGQGNGILVVADEVSVRAGATLDFSGGQLIVKTNSISETHLTTSVAGAGLAGGNGTALSVNVDNSTIEITTDTLNVKAAGITETHLNASVAGNGLAGGGGTPLSVNAGNGLAISGDDVVVGGGSGIIVTTDAIAVDVDNRTIRMVGGQVSLKKYSIDINVADWTDTGEYAIYSISSATHGYANFGTVKVYAAYSGNVALTTHTGADNYVEVQLDRIKYDASTNAIELRVVCDDQYDGRVASRIIVG